MSSATPASMMPRTRTSDRISFVGERASLKDLKMLSEGKIASQSICVILGAILLMISSVCKRLWIGYLVTI